MRGNHHPLSGSSENVWIINEWLFSFFLLGQASLEKDILVSTLKPGDIKNICLHCVQFTWVGHWKAAGKVDSLSPVESNQFLGRGRGGGCESSQHSFHNNDIISLTSSPLFLCSSWTMIHQRGCRQDKKEEPGCWPCPYTLSGTSISMGQ